MHQEGAGCHRNSSREKSLAPELGRDLPNVSYPEANVYVRQEGRGVLLGAYEDKCAHWAENGTPLDFGHELLPDDVGHRGKPHALSVTIPPLATLILKPCDSDG